MADRAADAHGDAGAPRPRPRPVPGPKRGTPGDAHGVPGDASPVHTPDPEVEVVHHVPTGRVRGRRSGTSTVAVRGAGSPPVVATAGSAIVTAARVGRLLGRSGWRIARQLPGVAAVEESGRRLRRLAADELLHLLDSPASGPSAEEQRAASLAARAPEDAAPLRSAMTELLERSAATSGTQSREYLFGTIVSQLVPDEARILSALGTGRTFAVVDVQAKGRTGTRTVAANLSTVGQAAGVALPDDVGTYLTRLAGYGLVEFGRPTDELSKQFGPLEASKQVREARAHVERTRTGSVRVVRKSLGLSALGREFWAACAPRRDVVTRRR